MGSQALATRSRPLCPRRSRARGHQRPGHLTPWQRSPPAPVTPRLPPLPARRRLPAPRCSEPGLRQLQKMAAKAAPVATLPRAGGAPQPRLPAPFPQPETLPAPTLMGSGSGGCSRGEGEGRLPACEGERGGGGGDRGQRRKGALGLSPPPTLYARCPREVVAPGWGNDNGALTSMTA